MAIGCNRAAENPVSGDLNLSLHSAISSHKFNSSLLYFLLCTVEMVALIPFLLSNTLTCGEREQHPTEGSAACVLGAWLAWPWDRAQTLSHSALWMASAFLCDTVFQKEICFLFSRDTFLTKEAAVSHFSWADRNTQHMSKQNFTRVFLTAPLRGCWTPAGAMQRGTASSKETDWLQKGARSWRNICKDW